MVTLSVKNVSAGYGAGDVIKNITFEAADGENLCIIGPNGCGKTTLLKTIARLLPYKGGIALDGADIKKMKRREIAANIAMLSQFGNVYFPYSVYDTVMLGRFIHLKSGLLGSPGADDRQAAEESLIATDLLSIKDKMITELSGGQLQRVFLARALAQRPRLILLDEPTNHLDIKYQAELIDYLKKWTAEGGNRSVIGVMHDINLALDLSDNIILMKDGEIRGAGKSKLISKRLLEDVYDMDIVSYMKNAYGRWNELAYK